MVIQGSDLYQCSRSMICYVPICFHYCFGSFILMFCLYSHNSVNLVIGVSSVRLYEGCTQISSQIVAKSLRKFLFCCLGWFSLKSLEVLPCLNIGSKFSLLVYDPIWNGKQKYSSSGLSSVCSRPYSVKSTAEVHHY